MVWEAFVSGSGKPIFAWHPADPNKDCQECRLLHQSDASIALAAFHKAFEADHPVSAVTANPSISLIGAAALWSGWTTSAQMLHEEAFVVRPA